MSRRIGVEEARQSIKNGEIVVFPTETAYGIAADPQDRDAVEKVYEAKKRPRSKGLTVICSSAEQAEEYGNLSENEKRLMERFMPGPLTLVTKGEGKLADNVNEDFAFRVSSSEVARQLASEFPITATSANISGNETSYSVQDVSEELVEHAAGVIDRGELDPSPTSTIAEVREGEVVVHREGPISLSELREVVADE